MHFFKSLAVCASTLTAFAAANIAFTSAPTGAQAGHSYKLTWTGEAAGQPVTIALRKGPSTNLQTVDTITTSASGGSFEWTVPANTPTGADYALQISQGADVNFWNVGGIAGGTASASASASVSSATSSASSVLSSVSSKASSLASSLSSKLSSATATTSSVSGSVTHSSSSSNSTVTKHTLTSTKTSSSSGSSSSGSSSGSSSTESSSSSASSAAAAPTQSGNDAAGLKSNAALVLGAVAAMAYLG